MKKRADACMLKRSHVLRRASTFCETRRVCRLVYSSPPSSSSSSSSSSLTITDQVEKIVSSVLERLRNLRFLGWEGGREGTKLANQLLLYYQ